MATEPRSDPDTDVFEKATADTRVGRLVPGMRVAITSGAMQGMEGVFVERRSGGKALLNLSAGVYLEVHEYWLVAVERE